MLAFVPTEDPPSLFDAVGASVKTAIPGELDAQQSDAAHIDTEIQDNIDTLEKETARHTERIVAKRAEREERVVTVCGAGQAPPEELRGKLEVAQCELVLAVVHSPTLLFPNEVMAEIFDWHMLMGGRLATTMLVCERWKTVAYNSPRLWSRISITNLPLHPRYLRGSVLCTNLDHLRLVLARSQRCALQVELSFLFNVVSRSSEYDGTSSRSSSLIRGLRVTANRAKAVKLILEYGVLKRCTRLVLANQFLPFGYQNTNILLRLSSIQVYSVSMRDHEQLFIQSLANLSPALQHIRCNRSLKVEDRGEGLWTEYIESYGWISPSAPCHLLHDSRSLRRLGVHRDPVVPLTLPALQLLRWSIQSYSALHRITAPHLHTLVLRHGPLGGRAERQSAGSISFPSLRVAIHTWIYDPTVLHMFHTPALEHLSIEYGSSALSSTALLELFDGCAHMPRPKSLHLDCTFTDAALIAVLGRLPWLEELQVAGTVVRDTFWEGMTPSCNPNWPVSVPESHTDGRATHILVPNLKVLLFHCMTGMRCTTSTTNHHSDISQVSKHPDEVSSGGNWMVIQASAVAFAREQSGCPLRILALWSLEQKVDVLIGSIDSLTNKPKFVSLTVLWYYYVLTSGNDRWEDDW